MKESDQQKENYLQLQEGLMKILLLSKTADPHKLRKLFTMESSDTHNKTNKYVQQIREKKGL